MKIKNWCVLEIVAMSFCPFSGILAQGTNTVSFVFAMIGDYGLAGTTLSNVAMVVKSWAHEFIVTVGDNNYYNGAASTIDANVGQRAQTLYAMLSG